MTTNNTSSEKTYYVLFVDDEEKTRKAFTRLFEDEFKILLAADGAEGFEVFQERQDEIGVIITDQKMPRETGVQFLAKVAAVDHDVVRILSTAYAELDAAVAGVNEGGIYRYVTKPWDVPELEITLRRAMELFALRKQQTTQSSTGSLDIEQILTHQQICNLAFAQATASQGSLGEPSVVAAVFLRMQGWQGLGEDQSIDWVERYRIAHEFFRQNLQESAEALAGQSALDWSRPAPPTAAIQAAIVGCAGLQIVPNGPDSMVWPGPAPILAEALRPLMVAFSELLLLLPGGTCEIHPNFNTVDFRFSGFPLKSGLLTLSTTPDRTPVLARFLQACLQVEATGGQLSLLHSNQGLSLRLGFEEHPPAEDPGLRAVKRLTAGN